MKAFFERVLEPVLRCSTCGGRKIVERTEWPDRTLRYDAGDLFVAEVHNLSHKTIPCPECQGRK